MKTDSFKEYPGQVFYGGGIIQTNNVTDMEECTKTCRATDGCSGGTFTDGSESGGTSTCALAKGNGSIAALTNNLNPNPVTGFVKDTTVLFHHYDELEDELMKLSESIKQELDNRKNSKDGGVDAAKIQLITQKLESDYANMKKKRAEINRLKEMLETTNGEYTVTTTAVESEHAQYYMWVSIGLITAIIAVCSVLFTLILP